MGTLLAGLHRAGNAHIARFQGLGVEAPRTQPQTAHLHGPAREPRLDAAAPSSLGLYHPGNEETKENHPESQRVRLQERHIKCQIKNELEERAEHNPQKNGHRHM